MRSSQMNGAGKTRIIEVKVQGIEKRKDHASKNLEFILIVKRSNGEQKTIARQYSMFFDLQGGLKQIYKGKPNIAIPDLLVPKQFPGAMLFSSLAKKEIKVIEEFCQKIIRLPSLVSDSDIVERFFSEWGTDAIHRNNHKKRTLERKSSSGEATSDHLLEKYRAMADYKACTSGEMTLDENEVVTVIEKNQTGWWLVTNEKGQHGFAPATFLEPLDPNSKSEAEEWISYDGEPRLWVALLPYTAQSNDEVSYSKGEEMEVIATSNFGWWKVRYHGKIGVTPVSNLKPKQESDERKFTNPIYDTADHPTYRGASFASVGPIYASIKRPPPRRDSSKEKMKRAALPNPENAKTLEYAVVQVGADFSPTRENPDVLYSAVIPKHLRPPRSQSPKTNKPELTKMYEEITEEQRAPTLPPCFVNDDSIPSSQEETYLEPVDSKRRLSAEETSTHLKPVEHGYLNVSKGEEGTNRVSKIVALKVKLLESISIDLVFHAGAFTPIRMYSNIVSSSFNADILKFSSESKSNLFKAVIDYSPPNDRYEDLPLSAGCIVRALVKDGPFYCVSTLDEPPGQGWVPEHILKNVSPTGKSDSNRRSQSLGDIIQGSINEESGIIDKLKELQGQTPSPAPRKDKRRNQSFDANGNTKQENAEHYETVSGIESLKLSNLAGGAPWYYGKLKRQVCEEIMLKTANELDFLVRESSQKFAAYVLSVKFSRKIRHFPIETTPSKKFVIGKHAFDSLPEIISFYTENPLFYTQNKEPVSLGQPFKQS